MDHEDWITSSANNLSMHTALYNLQRILLPFSSLNTHNMHRGVQGVAFFVDEDTKVQKSEIICL